jgi:hypothetical protein
MKVLQETGIALGTGVVLAGLAYSLVNIMSESPSDTNARVERCADHLGPVAVLSPTIPQECQGYSEQFGTSSKIHSLPSATDFRLSNQVTPEEAASDRRDMLVDTGIFGCAATLVTAAFRGELSMRRKRIENLKRL